MPGYTSHERLSIPPRLPLKGTLDLTYRCDNNCRHCWVWLPPTAKEEESELPLDEIVSVVNQARTMGCREWGVSGGEPMLRADFPEIFDYITQHCVSYTLNTNGTLITPRIARLMTRRGTKMVALYGATGDVHDNVTRNPGSFEATMRGISYLREAGAGFTVQIIPMKANHHQLDGMISLAESLGHDWRIGAPWLYLTACGDSRRNQEICRQRLDPRRVVELDEPETSDESTALEDESHDFQHRTGDDRLFASCITARRDFHIDPYGRMSFCQYLKELSLRYDLRTGSFEQCWDEFIPSLIDQVRGGREYLENCGACEMKEDCRWCPVYGYLEHRRFAAKVDYLCQVARESRAYKENWRRNHRRYYGLAGITIQVDSDLPITDETFHPKLQLFEIDEPGGDIITVRHHFYLPDLTNKDVGEEVYRSPPWAIFRKNNSWIYELIGPDTGDPIPQIAVFNRDHTKVAVYNLEEARFREGNSESLTLFPTDQVLLARVLADRQACYFHSSGVGLDGKGFLFVGHSEAGKSTMVKMLHDHAEVLCDERVVVRKWPDGFRIHGSWSHGEVPVVSPNSAPLNGICFLNKGSENRLVPIEDKSERIRKLLPCLVKALETKDWWDKTLHLLDGLAEEVPCYVLEFDRSGRVLELLKNL